MSVVCRWLYSLQIKLLYFYQCYYPPKWLKRTRQLQESVENQIQYRKMYGMYDMVNVCQLDELSDHLAAISEAVSEIHKVVALLRSVQDSYSTLVTALLAWGDDELTLVFVKQALLDEEQRREKPSESGGSEVALKSARKFSSKKRKAGNCFNCGQPGHFAQDCFKQKQKQKSIKEHHCAKRAEKQEDTDSDDNELFISTVELKADMQSNHWIIDSGASQHMTFESSILHGYKDFETPEPVGLGDGCTYTVSATGVGKVKVTTQLHSDERVVCWWLMCCTFPS